MIRLRSLLRATGLAGLLAIATSASLHFACSSDEPGVPSPPADGSSVRDAGPDARRDATPVTDAEPLIDAGFLADPAIWSPVPNDFGCPLFEARVVPDPFPPRIWSSCGAGCRVSPALLPIASAVAVDSAHSGGIFVGGEVYLSFLSAYRAVRVMVQQVVRLSDAVTVAATAIRGSPNLCTFGSGVADAPLLVAPFGTEDGGYTWTFGRVPIEPGKPITWQSSTIHDPSISNNRFMFDGAHGVSFASGEIGLLAGASADAFVVPKTLGTQVFDTAARGALLTVARFSTDGGGVIEGITADAAVNTLAEMTDETPVAIAMDGQRVAWITATGPVGDRSYGSYATTKFHSVPVVGTKLGTVEHGPVLSTSPGSAANRTLALAGDYAAAIACPPVSAAPDPTCQFQVVQLSTKKLWTIGSRPGGNTFTAVLAVSPTEVVLAEVDYPSHPPSGTIDRIVRVDIASLDSLGW